MTIELDGPREVIEELVLVDLGIVTRYPEGEEGALDNNTGAIAATTPEVIFDAPDIPDTPGSAGEGAPCAVSSSRTGDFMLDIEGDQEMLTSRFIGRFPYWAVGFRPGDILTMVESRDPELAGQEFVIKNVIRVTREVSRGVILEARHRGPETH